MKFIPPNPIKVDNLNDGGSSYGSEYGGRGRGGGGGGGGWSTRSFSPPESMPPRRKVADEEIDNLFDRTAAKINYKFDPENTKVMTEELKILFFFQDEPTGTDGRRDTSDGGRAEDRRAEEQRTVGQIYRRVYRTPVERQIQMYRGRRDERL